MNHPPDYADYAVIHPARWRYWWVALPALLFLAVITTILLWPEGKPTRTPSFWFWSVVLPLLCWLLAVALRALVWLQGTANRETYYGETERALEAWWREHSLALPVEGVVLVTPVGDETADHLALLSQPPDALPVSADTGGFAVLRCPLVLGDTLNRPVLLARYLANRLSAHLRHAGESRLVQCFCWLGDDASLEAFRNVMAAENIALPESVIRLMDVSGLADITSIMAESRPALLLCAGSGEGAPGCGEPVGEAAFAWLCSPQAPALLHRAEICLPAQGETAEQVVAQLSRYAQSGAAPDCVIAADKPAMDALLDGGWSALDHVLASWLGDAGKMTPFTLQSLALLSALSGQSCGWTASLMESQFITGVCVPRGNLPH